MEAYQIEIGHVFEKGTMCVTIEKKIMGCIGYLISVN